MKGDGMAGFRDKLQLWAIERDAESPVMLVRMRAIQLLGAIADYHAVTKPEKQRARWLKKARQYDTLLERAYARR